MKLASFEDSVGSTLLKRGQSYLEGGHRRSGERCLDANRKIYLFYLWGYPCGMFIKFDEVK